MARGISPCKIKVFGDVHAFFKNYVELLRDELCRFNVKVTEIKGSRAHFDVYYEWTHKNVAMHIFKDDLYCDNNGNIYFDSQRQINFDRAMFGTGESGKIPGSPSTIRELINQAMERIPFLFDRAKWLNPQNWRDGRFIHLGDANNLLRVAHRLLLIAVLKLSYTPIGLKRGGKVKRFDFNMPLLSIIT